MREEDVMRLREAALVSAELFLQVIRGHAKGSCDIRDLLDPLVDCWRQIDSGKFELAHSEFSQA